MKSCISSCNLPWKDFLKCSIFQNWNWQLDCQSWGLLTSPFSQPTEVAMAWMNCFILATSCFVVLVCLFTTFEQV